MSSRPLFTAPNYINTSPSTGTRSVKEYKDLFKYRNKQKENENENNNQSTYHQSKRYQMLYEHSKFLNAKLNEIRKQNQKEKDKDEIVECTFEPKLNKKIKTSFKKLDPVKTVNIKKNTKKQNNFKVEDLINRQEQWLEEQKEKNLLRKRNNEEKESYSFKPEKFAKDFNLRNLGTESYQIVEDPEGFINFVTRKKDMEIYKNNESKCKTIFIPDCRDNNKKRSKIKCIQNKKDMNSNNNYDYTKHRLIDTVFKKTNINTNNEEDKIYNNYNSEMINEHINSMGKILDNNENNYYKTSLDNNDEEEEKVNDLDNKYDNVVDDLHNKLMNIDMKEETDQ